MTLIRPGGRDCYPAFWVRDFSMSLDCGLISAQEIRHALRVIAQAQNGADERKLKSGAIVPAFAIADHINFDGQAVFYPGTYSAGEDQGGEPFGVLPPADDHYEFVHIAHTLWKREKSPEFLNIEVNGLRMFDRLLLAFDVPASDASIGGMFTTDAPRRAVGFGFCDAIYLTGAVLFASLLRYRAARELAEILAARGDHARAEQFDRIAKSIATHVAEVFDRGGGWLLAATKVGRQPDVWGTLYAIYLDVLPRESKERALRTIADAVRAGTIVYEGAVRHVPTDADFSRESAWEKALPGVKVNTYQNGAYWHTATGWLISALAQVDGALAKKVFDTFIAHLREQDFRKGATLGAPWECFGKDGKARQNAVYMTSLTVPLACLS
jgi:hypothetical protein